jgi:hypothetical protein
MNWCLLKPVCDFLDLETFLALRKVHRAARYLRRLQSTYDLALCDDCDFSKLLSLTGPVAELPCLQVSLFEKDLKRSELLPPGPRPRIAHVMIKTPATARTVFRMHIPSDIQWVTFMALYTRFDNDVLPTTLDRLDVILEGFHPHHICLSSSFVRHFQCTDNSASGCRVSFSNVDTFEYHPYLLNIFMRKKIPFCDECWPARKIILYLEGCLKSKSIYVARTPVSHPFVSEVSEVVHYCFGVNRKPTILEVHLPTGGFVVVADVLCKKFPSITDLTIHLTNCWIALDDDTVEDVVYGFDCLSNLRFVLSNKDIVCTIAYRITKHQAYGAHRMTADIQVVEDDAPSAKRFKKI